jgi:hypothetical protein
MSDFNNDERAVLITEDDCAAALDFWKHFNIPIPPALQKSFDNFVKSPTFENQENLKLQVCKAIVETNHPSFKEDMFSKIVEACQTVKFAMEFNEELENTLSSKTE